LLIIIRPHTCVVISDDASNKIEFHHFWTSKIESHIDFFECANRLVVVVFLIAYIGYLRE
jgi:hypothetical protein